MAMVVESPMMVGFTVMVVVGSPTMATMIFFLDLNKLMLIMSCTNVLFGS